MNKQSLKAGFAPGLVATLCCLGPLLLIMLGLISISTAVSITLYSKWFLGFAVVLFIGTLGFYVKKRRQVICHGCQTKHQERKQIITFIVFSVAVALLTFAVLLYVIIPWIAPIVLDNFYGGKR